MIYDRLNVTPLDGGAAYDSTVISIYGENAVLLEIIFLPNHVIKGVPCEINIILHFSPNFRFGHWIRTALSKNHLDLIQSFSGL